MTKPVDFPIVSAFALKVAKNTCLRICSLMANLTVGVRNSYSNVGISRSGERSRLFTSCGKSCALYRVENHRKKNIRTYHYECSLDLRESFAEQYVNLLRQSGFTLINHEVNDWRRLSPPRYLDKWILRYSEQQVEIWKYQYFEQGRKSFSIVVPNGLSYGGY